MEAEYSKELSKKLADYAEYIKTECKSPLWQKDKLLVDRQGLLDLLGELYDFHSVDLEIEDAVDAELGTVEKAKEKILKNAVWQAREIREEAEAFRKETMEKAEAEAKEQAEKILSDAKTYDERVKNEAKDIVNTTLSERIAELEAEKKELEDSREEILEEARKEGQNILLGMRKEAEGLKKELDNDVEKYRQQKEKVLRDQLRVTEENMKKELEEKTAEVQEVYAQAVQNADDTVNFVTKLYDQQIQVVKRDREEIRAIVAKLEKKN